MAREVNRLKSEDMAAANAWRLICVSSPPSSACWSRSRTCSCKAVRRRTTVKWRKLKH
ncbi:hypothetical protein ACNKHS_02815 [Shigella flexneri]